MLGSGPVERVKAKKRRASREAGVPGDAAPAGAAGSGLLGEWMAEDFGPGGEWMGQTNIDSNLGSTSPPPAPPPGMTAQMRADAWNMGQPVKAVPGRGVQGPKYCP